MRLERAHETEKISAAALLQGFANTDICVFLYYPAQKRIEVPKKVCVKYRCAEVYENMPYSLAEDFVHPSDYPVFFESYNKINQGMETSTAIFHSKDRRICWRVTLTAVGRNEDGSTQEALGIIEDLSEWDKEKQTVAQLQELIGGAGTEGDKIKEARDLVSKTIGSQFFALYHIWIDCRTYVCFQEQLSGILDVIGVTGDYEPAWNSYISHYIVPEDQAAMHAFADINTLTERLTDKQSISHEYRRKEVGWTRGQFIVAKRDANGVATNVIYTVMDINAEKNMQLAQSRAIFAAHHDPLTGAYNRKSFDEIVSSPQSAQMPIGLAIVDVDNFKIANDAFGHETGDRILKEIADLLKSAFRSEDSVFRIGGDEFAVLLHNCTPTAWKTLCKKQHSVHAALDQMFQHISITLSVGIAFSANGYNEQVYRLADERLYEVKQNGRAGCCMVDIENGTTAYWRDDMLSYKTNRILEFNNTGLYRIEYPLDGDIPPRLICGEMTRDLFGFSKECTPEECYRIWLEHIEPSYLDTMMEMREMALRGEQTECTYCWNHPTKGQISIRTGGTGETVNGVRVLRGYHHSMQDTKILERKDDRQLLLDSMSAIYFCSYYIDFEHNHFHILKNPAKEAYLRIQEDTTAVGLPRFLNTLVSPDDQAKMRAFTDHDTLQERMKNEVHLDCEYFNLVEKCWCRATYFPVKRAADGRLTHVLFVMSALDEQNAYETGENARSRKSIKALYNNVPGGLVLYECRKGSVKVIHVSDYFEKMYGCILTHGDRTSERKSVHPDDLAGFREVIQNSLMQNRDLRYDFRMWNLFYNTYRWTRVEAKVSVQPDESRLVYALYTDVTEQKEPPHNDTAVTLGKKATQ